MPRSRTVIKRQRQNVRRNLRRKSVRSELKTLERGVRTAGDADAAKANFKALAKALDQAAAHGTIHPNKAARKKSRLAKLAAKAST
jgi:small subunit ribosomal protein S20